MIFEHSKSEPQCDVNVTGIGGKVFPRVREEGEATLFLHRDSLAVVAVVHFYPHLAGRHLAATRRADDFFCRLQLWFVINKSQ